MTVDAADDTRGEGSVVAREASAGECGDLANCRADASRGVQRHRAVGGLVFSSARRKAPGRTNLAMRGRKGEGGRPSRRCGL